jgi:hypothetical protein
MHDFLHVLFFMALPHEVLVAVVVFVVPEFPILHPVELVLEVPDLSHFDLSHFDISHFDLSHLDLSHFDISHFDLSHLDLSHFDISHFVSVVLFDLSQVVVAAILQEVLGVASVFVTSVEVDVELVLCAFTLIVDVKKTNVIETIADVKNNLFIIYFF